MKQIIPVTALLLLLSISMQAQSTRRIEIGPTAGVNISMNTADYHVSNVQRAIVPGFFGGIQGDFPIGTNASVLVNLGYYTLGFSDENEYLDPDYPKNLDVKLGSLLTTEGTFSYVTLSPAIKFGEAFFIGFNFGLPVSAEITNAATFNLPFTLGPFTLAKDISPSDDERKFLVEIRLGGMFNIISDETGSLRISLTGSYPITEAATSPTNNSKLPRLDDNFRLPSLMLNLSYMFGM